jgi:methyltransferase
MRHPNYLAVIVELLAAPLMFGAWRTAVAISLLDLVALGIRIHAEEVALRGTASRCCGSWPQRMARRAPA